MAKHLIGGHGYGVGKVEAPQSLTHGEAKASLGVFQKQFLREPGVLPAKDQPGPVRKALLGIDPPPLGGEEEQLLPLDSFEEGFQAGVAGDRSEERRVGKECRL